MARTPEADTPATPVRRDPAQDQKGDAAATLPPDPGEGAAAEASPAADGPPPAQADGDALIAEMAFPITGEPEPVDGPARDGDAAAGDGADPRGQR